MSEEEKKDVRLALIDGYKTALEVTPEESALTVAFYKFTKANAAIEILQEQFLMGEVPIDHAMIAMDVLLGGVVGIRKDIK